MKNKIFIFISLVLALVVFMPMSANGATGDLSNLAAKAKKYYVDYRSGAKSVNDAANVISPNEGKIDTKVYNFKLTKKSKAEVETGGCKHSFTPKQRESYKKAATQKNPSTGNTYISDANPDNTIDPNLYALCSTSKKNVGFAVKYKNTGTY